MPTIRLIEMYTVEVPGHERLWITENVTLDAERTKDELADVRLLEIEVKGDDGNFDVEALSQESSDQVPWLPRYFSEDGEVFLGEEKPSATDYRVCFFLHYVQLGESIVSPYGALDLASTQEMPSRLRRDCVYEHPG